MNGEVAQASAELILNSSEPKKEGHVWVQKGNRLICTACQFEHVTFVPNGKELRTDENGNQTVVSRRA